MTHSFTGPSPEPAQAMSGADYLELDREAWNLPRASAGTVSHMSYRAGLDWDGFRDLYFPGSRRNDLKAIVAYGGYRSSQTEGER